MRSRQLALPRLEMARVPTVHSTCGRTEGRGAVTPPGPIPLILGLTGIIRICFESPGLSRNQDHAPPNNSKPRRLANSGLMPVAIESMGEFDIRPLRSADVSGRFAAAVCGPDRESPLRRRPNLLPASMSGNRVSRGAGTTEVRGRHEFRNSGNFDCPNLVVATLTGNNAAGADEPKPEHGSRPEPRCSWRPRRTAEVDSDGEFSPGRQVPVP